MKIAIGCDHGGFPLKATVIETVQKVGHETMDLGTFSSDPADYPDYSEKVAQAVQTGLADRGIVICGSGVGATVAANKFKGIRAGLCHDTFSARQGVEDDDMNVLTLGARIIGPLLAIEVIQAFLKARFSNAERHLRRLNKVKGFEENFGK
ncbi:ribose 5-phosphate isomerase B [bacterium]|nr:ribose 5-phosphate isomerase B [bacterium]NUN45472.1 ribose 5-phosphate isomerase B [bacterium]